MLSSLLTKIKDGWVDVEIKVPLSEEVRRQADSVYFKGKIQLVLSLADSYVSSWTSILKLLTQYHFVCRG